jgi:1,4-dihydroxy-2-naphthoate octaprenyltransferase
MQTIEKNSLKAWILASRPKTLAAGSVPVIVATALAAHDGMLNIIPAILCLFFALLAQVASNFSNDYFDFKKKTDNEDRLGPARAVSSGWIDPGMMLIGIFVTITVACLFGMGLLWYGGWEMIIVGIVCVVSLLAYTAGPWPLAYNGLGDVFVLVFFGFVAVIFSYYVQTHLITPQAFICGGAVGLAAVNILILNNYRDRETDKKSNKKTTIVIFGEKFGRRLYLINGFISCLLCMYFIIEESYFAAFLPLLYLIPHILTWKKMVAIDKGKALNPLLGETSRNLLILGVLVSAGLLLKI